MMKGKTVGYDKIGLTIVGMVNVGTYGESIGEGGVTPVGTGRYLTSDGSPYRLSDGSYYIVNQN